jgi:signal transduction histidine kinase
MTGATGVRLLLWDPGRQDWLLPAPGGGTIPAGDTGREPAVPMSVLRYVQRTGEPLVAGDATGDDRFARDPYFAGITCCALLAVPVLSRGALRAVLLLENRLIRGAFTTGRLDAVSLIAGQLAVSLDNAQLYADYRQVAGEQAALRRVATLVARAAPPGEVFAAVTEEAGRLIDAAATVLARYDPDGTQTTVGVWSATGTLPVTVGTRTGLGGRNVSTLVFQTGQPARIDDYADVSGPAATHAHAFRIRASVGAPVSVEGRLWGIMIVASEAGPLPAGTEARLAGFTELAATAIANAQARTELRGFADEQAALRRVATLVARGEPPEAVFAAVLEEVGRLLPINLALMGRYESDRTATCVAAWRTGGDIFPVGSRWPLEGHNLGTLVFETSRPARIDNYADSASGPIGAAHREAGTGSAVGAPIIVEGCLWGMIYAGSTLEPPLPPDTEARLVSFTELVATAIANAQSRAELIASRARIAAAADETRRRIERDLHDGAQQRLVSLAVQLRAAQATLPRELGAQLDGAVAEAVGALDELRETARGIHPAILAERGLAPALKTLARRSPVPVDLQVQVNERLPEPVEVSAYYVIAEALTNAAKHARASTISVQTQVADDVLLLAVRDDGAGGADFTRGTGLAGLKDRVEALGGRIFLDSPRGAGTSLQAEFPLTVNGGIPSP